MEPQIVDQLLRLNSDFYARFGDAFSQTRGPQQPGLHRLVSYLPGEGGLLDVGCGNGRLAHVLDQAGLSLTYLGLDASESLLTAARAQAGKLHRVQASFLRTDFTQPGWEQALPVRRFEVITSLAVLHHLPGWRVRSNLLHTLRALLAYDGVLALSTWQFLSSDHLRRKIVPWSSIGLSPDQVDPGDYLLDWQRSGYGLRYCRFIDQEELVALAGAANLRVLDAYHADGTDGHQNLFLILGHCNPDNTGGEPRRSAAETPTSLA